MSNSCPLTIGGFWLTVNRECNNRCPWCYAQATDFAKKDMSLETAFAVLKMMSEIKAEACILIGGEPTLYPHLLPVIEKLSEYGINSSLVTNGILLHKKDFLQKLLDSGLNDITVSLKAANKKQYKELTGNSGFDLVLKAIHNLVELGVKGGVSITLTRPLAGNLSEIARVAVDNGIKAIKVDFGSPIIVGDKLNTEQVLNPREAAESLMAHYPEIDTLDASLTVEISLPFCLFPREFIQELIGKGQLLSGCHLVRKQGIIFDPEGNIIPCNIFTDYPIGKYGTDFHNAASLIDHLKTDQVIQFYQKTSSLPSVLCKDCDDWIRCCGGCVMKWLAFDPAEFIERR